MRLVCAPAQSSVAVSASAALFNEGLEPGARVILDDRADQTGTICFVEPNAAYAHIRLDCDGERIRLESWRLGLIDVIG